MPLSAVVVTRKKFDYLVVARDVQRIFIQYFVHERHILVKWSILTLVKNSERRKVLQYFIVRKNVFSKAGIEDPCKTCRVSVHQP